MTTLHATPMLPGVETTAPSRDTSNVFRLAPYIGENQAMVENERPSGAVVSQGVLNFYQSEMALVLDGYLAAQIYGLPERKYVEQAFASRDNFLATIFPSEKQENISASDLVNTLEALYADVGGVPDFDVETLEMRKIYQSRIGNGVPVENAAQLLRILQDRGVDNRSAYEGTKRL